MSHASTAVPIEPSRLARALAMLTPRRIDFADAGDAVVRDAPTCGYDGCSKPTAARGRWCSGHKKQRERNGEAGMSPLRGQPGWGI